MKPEELSLPETNPWYSWPDDLNRTGSMIEPIERDRTIEIRLPNVIERPNSRKYSIGSIEIRLPSIEILRSIAFDLGSILCSIMFEIRLVGR